MLHFGERPRAGRVFVVDDAERRTEEQQRHGRRMEAIGHLACGIAHDFNNLLTVINGYANALVEEGGWDPHVARMLTAIHKAGTRSTLLTSQLLAFSRKQAPETHAINLNELVGGLDEMLQRLIGEDVKLLTCLDPNIATVRADGSQLEQVVMNLVLNARDALPRGGRVTVQTASVAFDEPTASPRPIPSGDYVLLSVADTGVGMKAHVREHIFEPFFTTKELGKGTGLGLATVYGIVRQAGGHILVFSALGVGTVFKVYLPVAVAAAGDDGATAVMPEPSGSETILLVEDDADVREFASHALGRFGFQVLTAPSGAEALALCETYPGCIDLLVSDVIMPAMNGPDLAKRVRRARPGTRVLFLSGYTDEVVVGRGLERDAFLQKPFSSEALARKIRDVLDGAVRVRQ
jgi:two-component system cell cycle sensor histidine kinase/response regulator CckA